MDYDDRYEAQVAKAEQAWQHTDALSNGGRWKCVYQKDLGVCTYHFMPSDKHVVDICSAKNSKNNKDYKIAQRN